ncbi:MAG: hypothetical protein QM743_09805 [Chitinophagaceae bacterium]
MTKYAANSYLAMRISFMNEMANLCEEVGANVDWVRIGMGSDNRIGKRFLFPGVGYGGSCFPKDVQALAHTAEEYAYDFKILKTVMKVNDMQKLVLGEEDQSAFRRPQGEDICNLGTRIQAGNRRYPRSAIPVPDRNPAFRGCSRKSIRSGGDG